MAPEPRAVEHVEHEGRRYRIEWFDPPFVPPLRVCTQAYGLCVTHAGEIVLIENEPGLWQLPGGGVEAGETLEETLAREVMEEACARVLECRYIGCQRVTPDDQVARDHFDGRATPGIPYYQTRFWARVELDEWNPQYETTARLLVAPDEFLQTLWWGSGAIPRIILENGLGVERARGR